MNITDIQSVLVIKPSSMGDVIHTLPAVRLLKRARPQLSIRWLVNTEWAPLLAGNPDLDAVIEFPRNDFRGPAGLFRLAAWMKKAAPVPVDLALDFQGLIRSALLAKFSRARRVHCLGDAEIIPRISADRVVPATRNIHAVLRYLKLVEDLGVPVDGPLDFPLPEGVMPEGFGLREPFLLLHPFSRGRRKSLEPEVVRELCERIRPVPVVLAGRSPIAPALPSNCLNLMNRTSIPELVWLIRRAGFTVSVDSGPMHIAAAISGRLLGIHHWTDPRIVGPFHPEAWVWKNGALRQVKSSAPPDGRERPRELTVAHLPQVVEFLKAHFNVELRESWC